MLKIRQKWTWLFYLVLIISCNAKPTVEPSKIRTSFRVEPTTLDTRKNGDTYTSTLHFLLFEGLTRLKENGEIEMAIAKSVEISPDGLIYEFHLRDAFWTDGVPITAYDFEHSWKKILTPNFGSPNSYLFFLIKNSEEIYKGEKSLDELGVIALNEKTLRVELKAKAPFFLSLVSFCCFYPIPSHIEQLSPQLLEQRGNQLVSSGPFKLKKWRSHQEIELEKNGNYWDRDNVHLSGINIIILRDELTAMRMFDRGHIDCLSSIISPLSQEEIKRHEKLGSLKISPLGGLVFCAFNLDLPPFQNPNLRRALSSAIDRIAIARQIGSLHEEPAFQILPPLLRTEKQLIPPPANTPTELFNLALQEENLTIDTFPSITLIYESTDQFRQIALAIQEQWKQVLGIDIHLKESDSATLFNSISNRKFSICLTYLGAQCNDPIYVLDRFKFKKMRKNIPGYENPLYIEQLDIANKASTLVERNKALVEAEKILLAEAPIAPIYYMNQGVVLNSSFTHFTFSPIGNILFKYIEPTDKDAPSN